jgi:serine/threonine-protein kinase HipA
VTRELVVLLNGVPAGTLRQARGGATTLTYDDAWRDAAGAYPLSLSMPLARREHAGAGVDHFLEGLLPDNEQILARWGTRFGVSPRNAFGLIAHVGEDCPGAVQFVAPERLAATAPASADSVEWLTEEEIAERLRHLRRDHAAWREAEDTGHFSLAGAQPKTALLLDGERWGVPSGRTPTTHILKPPHLAEFPGFAENEHLCLRLAGALGMPAADSEVVRFGDEVAIVVRRYDRASVDGRLVRVHQEDVCQALGLSPRIKYEAEGGPGLREVVALLRGESSEPDRDLARLVDAVALNWVIGGTDAHAKNYSLLIAPGGEVRLAPLYDVVSALPYPRQIPRRKLKFAMKLGGEYHVWKVDAAHWIRFGRMAELDAESVLSRVRELLSSVPDAVHDVCGRAREEGLTAPVVDLLRSEITAEARRCLAALDRPAG